MARTSGSHGPSTAEAIRLAGIKLIFDHGFEAMSLRQLAAEVGLQPASLYNHISSKQDFLFALIRDHMAALIASTDAALASQDGAQARLCAFIAHHLTYHLDKKREVYIANFELRALSPKHRKSVVEQRRLYEQRLIDILDQGRISGALAHEDSQVTAYAILAMLTGACTWYRPDGRLSDQALIALHTRLILSGCLPARRALAA